MSGAEIDRLHAAARKELAEFWQMCIEDGTDEVQNLENFARVFEALADAARWLKDLPDTLPDTADQATLLSAVERAVLRFNTVNEACGYPIETDEREIIAGFLCEAAAARGLDLDRVEHRDPTLAYREW